MHFFSGFIGSGVLGAGVGIMVIILLLWNFIWKGLALWRAAQRKELWWFIAMLVINTMGILEIIYLFVIVKAKPAELFAFTGMTGKKTMSNSTTSDTKSV